MRDYQNKALYSCYTTKLPILTFIYKVSLMFLATLNENKLILITAYIIAAVKSQSLTSLFFLSLLHLKQPEEMQHFMFLRNQNTFHPDDCYKALTLETHSKTLPCLHLLKSYVASPPYEHLCKMVTY